MSDQPNPFCPYCDGPLYVDDGRLSNRDHIIPKVLGGNKSPENMILVCRGCNVLKGNMTPNAMRAFADDIEARAAHVRKIAARVEDLIERRALSFGVKS